MIISGGENIASQGNRGSAAPPRGGRGLRRHRRCRMPSGARAPARCCDCTAKTQRPGLVGSLSRLSRRLQNTRRWIRVDALPLNAAGKVDKPLLRRLYTPARLVVVLSIQETGELRSYSRNNTSVMEKMQRAVDQADQPEDLQSADQREEHHHRVHAGALHEHRPQEIVDRAHTTTPHTTMKIAHLTRRSPAGTAPPAPRPAPCPTNGINDVNAITAPQKQAGEAGEPQAEAAHHALGHRGHQRPHQRGLADRLHLLRTASPPGCVDSGSARCRNSINLSWSRNTKNSTNSNSNEVDHEAGQAADDRGRHIGELLPHRAGRPSSALLADIVGGAARLPAGPWSRATGFRPPRGAPSDCWIFSCVAQSRTITE